MHVADSTHSTNVLRYGGPQPLPERIALRAGPLRMFFEGGDLRAIHLGEREIVGRIYVAVRDQNWGTVPGHMSNLEFDVRDDMFRISYDMQHRQDVIDFRWRALISGDPSGAISFAMDGVAHSTFLRNRTGFCVLHPASSAGASCMIEHVDGATETTTLPVPVIADQPVRPFSEMRALTQTLEDGVRVRIGFSGDTFEMEDQRNWTDASYKTFCTPLRLPYPVEVSAGARVEQSVSLALETDNAVLEDAQAATSLRFALGTNTYPLPRIGLGVASDGYPLSHLELGRLKALRLAHLRIDLRLADANVGEALRQAWSEAQALGIPLEIAVLLAPTSGPELAVLRDSLVAVAPRISRWLVYPAVESLREPPPTAELVALARQYLADYDPQAPFGAGTNSDFVFLNRHVPPVENLDLVAFAINPQVHAFDNASVVETLAMQGVVVENARRLAPHRPVVVSPITLKPRFNPYASVSPTTAEAHELPAEVDPRQMSLLGAGWTAVSIKYLAERSAWSTTYYETVGWRGVMERADGSPLPERFRSIAGGVFPLYHVLADVGEWNRGALLATTSSAPLLIDGFALREGTKTRVVLANLSDETQMVQVEGVGGDSRVRVLDETNVVNAMDDPEGFRVRQDEHVNTPSGVLEVRLRPYAVVRIDSDDSPASNGRPRTT